MVILAVALLLLSLLPCLHASAALEKEYRTLFLDRYQRAAVSGDYPHAVKLARQRQWTDKDRAVSGQSMLDMERQARIQLLCILEDRERLTEESMEPIRVSSIEQAISIYRDALLARRQYYATVYYEHVKLLEQARDEEEQLTAYIADKDRTDPIVQERIRRTKSRTNKILRVLNYLGGRIGKDFVKYSERKAFILAYPQYFVDPSPHPVKVSLRPGFGPIHQSIAFIDAFTEAMPRSLRQFCTNYKELQEQHDGHSSSTIYIEDLHSRAHGCHVAGFALSLASSLTFEAIPSSLIGTAISSTPKRDYGDAAFYRVHGPAIAGRDIEFLVNSQDDPMFVTDGTRIFAIPWYASKKIDSPIINISLSFQDSRGILGLNMYRYDMPSMMAVAYAFTQYLVEQDKLAVFALGNESLILSTTTLAYSLIKALAECKRTQEKMIVVAALAADGISLARFSNQPGDHLIAERTICAPGEELAMPDGFTRSGTSFSTPIVSTALASLKSHFPRLPQVLLAQLILDSATPVITIPSLTGQKAVLLEGLHARDFRPGMTFSSGRESFFITEDMYKASRAKYGMGILNLEAAIQLAAEHGIALSAKL